VPLFAYRWADVAPATWQHDDERVPEPVSEAMLPCGRARDSEARGAGLAIDHVLTRAGLGLHAAEPLFCVARAAGDTRELFMTAQLLRHLSGPIA
jgi:hypothetical protein